MFFFTRHDVTMGISVVCREKTKKKTAGSFSRYLSKFLSQNVNFFSEYTSRSEVIFRAYFWDVEMLVTLIFHGFFYKSA